MQVHDQWHIKSNVLVSKYNDHLDSVRIVSQTKLRTEIWYVEGGLVGGLIVDRQTVKQSKVLKFNNKQMANL